MNGLELVQTHGIVWFCDRYKPKDKEETLVLEYLKENEGVEKHFTRFLASLSLEAPDDGVFTQPEGESAENNPQSAKENNQTKTNDMYRPTPSRYVEDAIEATQWMDKALKGLEDYPEAWRELLPFIPSDLGRLLERLKELRKRYLDEDERNRKARKEYIDSLPTFGADKPSEPLHVDEGGDRGGVVPDMPSLRF